MKHSFTSDFLRRFPALIALALVVASAMFAPALEGMARQPEASGTIQTAMIIGLALIESLVIYALLMFFILQAKLPAVSTEALTQMVQAGAR